MKNMVAYSIPLVLSTALGTIALQLDKIIVSAMCGPEEFAVYSNGAIEIPLIGIMTGSIAAVIQPDLRRMVAAGDTPAALALFRLAAEKSAFVLIPVMMFLLLSAEPFILTLFSAKYVGSVLPFRLYLLILPARIVFFGSFLMALGLNTVILYRTITSILVNLVVSIVLVYWLGYIGAIIGTIVSIYIIACAWNLIVIAQSVGCKWWETIPFVNLFKVFGVAGLACISTGVLGMCYSKLPSFAILLLNILLYLSTYVFFIWYMRVDILMREGMRLWAKLNSYWKLAMSLH
jgi:O-antigen/teichoic acid export membrane protein